MSKMESPLHIAIDGPVASGKGEVASQLAEKLHLLYINTGAMYRMLALACHDRGVDTKDGPNVSEVFRSISLDMLPPKEHSVYSYRGLINGQDVTERLLNPDVSQGASDVGVFPDVRKIMVKLQQKLAEGKSVVMEGRDIGLRVLPDSQLKIYLTATLEERARRRMSQWQEKGFMKSFDEVMNEVRIRDKQDMERATDPLQKLPDAWELDSTHLTREEVVQEICDELKRRTLV